MSAYKAPRRDYYGVSNAHILSFDFPTELIDECKDPQYDNTTQWQVPGGKNPRDHSHLEGDAMFQYRKDINDIGNNVALSSYSGLIFQKSDTRESADEKLRCLGPKVNGSIDGKAPRSQGDSAVLVFGGHDVLNNPVRQPLPYGTNVYISFGDMKTGVGGLTEEANERIKEMNQFPDGIKPDMEGSGKKRVEMVTMRPYETGSPELHAEHTRWLMTNPKNKTYDAKHSTYKKLKSMIELMYRQRMFTEGILKSADEEVTPELYKKFVNKNKKTDVNRRATLISELNTYIQTDSEYYFKTMLSWNNRYFTTCIQPADVEDSFQAFRAKV